MAIPRYRVFFDTSVYIAALLSPGGAAGELIRLAEAGAIQMVVSEQVILESDRVIGAEFPDLVQDSRNLWKSLAPEIASNPPSAQLKAFAKLLPRGDAAILGAAVLSKAELFVTWNTRDFMGKDFGSLIGFAIVVPGDALKLFREWIEPYLD